MKAHYIESDQWGNTFHYNNRAMTDLDREDGPAVEWNDGTKSWYRNGQRHREDGPAVEWPDGTTEWYLNGEPLTEAEFNNPSININGKNFSIGELETLIAAARKARQFSKN